MRKTSIGAAVAAVLVMGATAAAAAMPGAHRAACPQCFGLTDIGSGIYTDAPRRAAELRSLIKAAEARVSGLFGPLEADPRYIVCTTPWCHDAFGHKPRGITYGATLIIISPLGVNGTIITHERSHAELYDRMTIADYWNQRFPAWFDEGLATHLARDSRMEPDPSFQERERVLGARTFRDWNRMAGKGKWRETYSAAAAEVREIEDAIGADGLRTLIRDVAAGADFDARLAQLEEDAGRPAD